MKRNNCLSCQSKNLTNILDLGMHAFADTFVDMSRNNEMLPVYRLSCVLCGECGLVQTDTITSAEDRYNLFDYSYTSSNSRVAKDHWNSFAREATQSLNLNCANICEIGSNDGYLLSIFQSSGHNVLGVDASEHMSHLANSNGIKTIPSIFDEEVAAKIIEESELFDLVVANNVFNHSDNPMSFLSGVYSLMDFGSHFIFEVPYWKCTIDSNKIDQVYHEHVTYLTATSVKNIVEKFNLNIVNIEVVDYHGGSLRVCVQKIHPKKNSSHCLKLQHLIDSEKYLFDIKTYRDLQETLQKKKILFLKKILFNKVSGKPLIAIGAAAKGNTLLNYLSLNNTIVDWVTDVSKFKQGKRTPLSNIPICDDNILREYDDVCALILSWNLSDSIKNKLLDINPNIEFINFYEE